MFRDIWEREKVKVPSVYWQRTGEMKVNWPMLGALFAASLLGKHGVASFVYDVLCRLNLLISTLD